MVHTFLLIRMAGPSPEFAERHLSDPRSLQTQIASNVKKIHGDVGVGGCALSGIDVIKVFGRRREEIEGSSDSTEFVRAIMRVNESTSKLGEVRQRDIRRPHYVAYFWRQAVQGGRASGLK